MATVAALVEQARADAATPYADAATAHAEMVGYQRFLRAAGRHLFFLDGLAQTSLPAEHQLARHLSQLTVFGTEETGGSSDGGDEPREGLWEAAARHLGAAHDLLASHQHRNLPRTPQGEDLDPAAAGVAMHTVAGLVFDAVSARSLLARSVIHTQKSVPVDQRRVDANDFRHLNHTGRTTETYTKAALWELDHAPSPATPSTDRSLDAVEPATVVPLHGPPARFEDSIAALKTLRQLSYAQAHGRAAASPASLRDLALLGARLTGPDRPWLPEPNSDTTRSSGLDRLRRAHAADGLDAAHRAWREASMPLTTLVHGLTRAPGAYGVAIQHLLQADLADRRVALAICSTLPRLGREAAATIEDLGAHGGLVTKQQEPGTLHKHWRTIPEDQLSELSDSFRSAAENSTRAHAAVRDLLAHEQSPARGAAISAPPPVRRRERTTEVTR